MYNAQIFSQAAAEKKRPESHEVPPKKQRMEESGKSIEANIPEKSKEVPESTNVISSTNTMAKSGDEKDSVNNSAEADPLPSTSGACKVDVEKTDVEKGIKRYKKSLAYLQFQWCKKQPEYITLREEILRKHE